MKSVVTALVRTSPIMLRSALAVRLAARLFRFPMTVLGVQSLTLALEWFSAETPVETTVVVLNRALLPEHSRVVLDGVHAAIEANTANAAPEGGWFVLPVFRYQSLSGNADGFRFDGQASQQLVSADYGVPDARWGLGLVAGRTDGRLAHTPLGVPGYQSGRHDLETVSVTPYLRGEASPWGRRTTGWTALTLGYGSLSLTGLERCDDDTNVREGTELKGRTTLQAAAAGMSHALTDWGLSVEAGFETSATKVKDARCIQGQTVRTRDAHTRLRWVAPGQAAITPEAYAGVQHAGGDGATGRSWAAGVGATFQTPLWDGTLAGRLGFDAEEGYGGLERESRTFDVSLRYRAYDQRGLELDGTGEYMRMGYAAMAGDGGRIVPFVLGESSGPLVLGLERRFHRLPVRAGVEGAGGDDPYAKALLGVTF